MRLDFVLVGIMSLVGCGLSAIAPNPALAESVEEEPSAQLTQPDPKLNDLAFFARTWKCESPSVDNPDQMEQLSWTVLRELNDFWYLGLTENSDLQPVKHDTMGFNTVFQKFGRTILTNDGRFANFLSDGWDGNTITWDGSVVNMVSRSKGKHRIVMTKTGEHAFDAIEYELNDQKSWKEISSQTCVWIGKKLP